MHRVGRVARSCIFAHHDTEVDDAVVVASEDDADDVLPDVVDVPLHRRQNNSTGVTRLKFSRGGLHAKEQNQLYKRF